MSHIGKNIKKIRSVKKLSQSQFAELFGINRGNIGAYEEERAEPKIDMIVQMAHHFGLSVDILLTKELSVNDLYSFNILNKKLDQAHHFTPIIESENKKKKIRLVPLDRQLEYLVNHNSQDFLSKLESIELPTDTLSEYLAFEIGGSEMEYNQNGLHHGDILLCKKCIPESKHMLKGQVYTIVAENSINTRRLQSIKKDQVYFSSDDPNYPLMDVALRDIIALWQVVGSYSTYINPPRMIEERVMMIENELKLIKRKMEG
jgi:transcriptional regulator with XRE-family HTH domain